MNDTDYLNDLARSTKLLLPLDEGVSCQSIEEGLKYTISKTQENVQIVSVFQKKWNPDEGDVMAAYIHGQTEPDSGLGKIGSIIHLSREDRKSTEALATMGQSLAMHIAAMKP